ncbi:hypothetical protein J3R83DRAFT_8025 [Lanmaoa asiatica]|nr:hypothetical protein J3R83DRAFT_8025 [Lanmaoa asiatica]
MEDHYAALRHKYDTQKIAYSTLHDRCETLKATLEQRTSELHGVQKFLTTADTFSGSEVVNVLRKLNEEVQQTTTFMAEWAVGNFMFETPPPDQTSMQTIKQTRTSKVLGMRFVQLLGEKMHRDNPIVVEMAFRAYLTYELFWIASSWSTGQQQSHNAYIDGIHQRMQEGGERHRIYWRGVLTRHTTVMTEGQAISGNWRALTRKYTFPDCMNDRELAHKIDSMLVSGCTDILLAAGCTTAKSDIESGLWSKFAEKMHHFVSLAGQVNKIIGMGVISEDFHVVVVAPEAIFDKKDMEDSYDNDDKDQGTKGRPEIVLCATELGLLQRGRVGAGAGQGGEPSESIVMKPKVALASVMDIFND